MHAEIGDKSSKTKVVFFPRTRIIKRLRHSTNYDIITSQENNDNDVEFKENKNRPFWDMQESTTN